MEAENFDLDEIMESRRKSVAESLREVGAEDLRKMEREIFPYTGHPWEEAYLKFINENANCQFFHGKTEDGFQVLYCRARERGVWFKPGVGLGLIQPRGLAVMKEIVDHRNA